MLNGFYRKTVAIALGASSFLAFAEDLPPLTLQEALMGVVMMVGIVVSNSILIVEFTNRLRSEGRPLRQAIVLACRVRLRPVLMTSLATLFGLLPMAAKLGAGSEAYAPLARSIIGGLAVSVVLTVFIVPCAYYLIYRRRESGAGDAVLQPAS